LLGFGEAVNWPFSTRIVANLLPREDRGLGMGIFNSGAALGALAAPLIITPIAHAYGWRWAFLTTGSVGVLWVLIWLWFTRSGRASAFANPVVSPAASPPAAGFLRTLRTLLSYPGFWLLLLVSVTINPCWYFCCDWIPGYLKEQSGFSFLRSGLLATFIFLGGDIGNYLGGGLVKYLTHRGWSVRKARGTAVAVGAGLASCMALVPHVENTYLIITLLALAGIGINAVVPNQTACVTEVSFQNTAQLAGLMGLAANVFAALVNPRIGQYVDATQHYNLVFYLVAVFPWIAVGAILAFDRLIEGRATKSGWHSCGRPSN
jgi:ACS family hexuronate transporter-like MFS transporter